MFDGARANARVEGPTRYASIFHLLSRLFHHRQFADFDTLLTNLGDIMKKLALFLLLLYEIPASAQDVIFLVRHADRASSEPDSLLSQAGEQRAQCLASMLKDVNLKAIYTSEFKRTQQTAAPTAAEFHLEPKAIPRANVSELVKDLKDTKDFPILVVAHSETLPPIVQQLGAGTVSQPTMYEYDKLIVIPVHKGKAEPAFILHYCSAATDTAPTDRTMPSKQ